MRRRRNPRGSDSTAILGIAALGGLAYWYFFMRTPAPAAHAAPALAPHNSTLTIPTVPASSTLATPVTPTQPFQIDPPWNPIDRKHFNIDPSTLLPSGPAGWLDTPVFSAAPALNPGARIISSPGEVIDDFMGATVRSVGSGPLRCIMGQEPNCTVFAPQGTVLVHSRFPLEGVVDTVQ